MAETLHQMAKRAVASGANFGSSVNYLVRQFAHADHEKAVAELTAWAAANPVKTYRDDFFEKFPDAQKRLDGYPIGWVCDFYKTRVEPQKFRAAYQYQKSWDAPLGTWGEKEKDDA